ncbi:hypothetical protein DVR12_11400 [Chitinophaga silvatica]|uniref:DUF4397 domain-containing protein n=1 Tax=Chitinophaga silvatica TaxID=2282649 RepID=A0A3E1Y9M9_9BACT|nr:hypothetical protein [Chitinophaga silvatica]RFS22410.1 hypothetical protein DVR12_11400 [Chitinophaga silvatica]
MKSKNVLILIVSLIVVMSCRKGEMPTHKYFGSVSSTVANLPGTPMINIKWNGVVMDSLMSGVRSITLPAGQSGKLSYTVAGSNDLIADTVITVPMNNTLSFKILASTTLGMSGFAVPVMDISPDSIKLQVYCNLSDYYKYSTIDLKIISIRQPGNVFVDELVVKGLKNKHLSSEIITFKHKDDRGAAISYGAYLIDPATNEVIPTPKSPYYFLFARPQYPGFYIVNLTDRSGTMASSVIGL